MASFTDVSVLFDEGEPASLARRFEAYKAALDDSASKSATLEVVPGEGIRPRSDPASRMEAALADMEMNKSVSADAVASIRSQLEASKAVAADIQKDLSLTSPLSSGLVPYDLEAPAKLLTPRPTPLRNRIVREKGQGTARRFKRILGFTGTGTGGVGLTRPGITDTTTNTFGSLAFVRGPKISYAADEKAVTYKQFSLSDQVNWSAQFSGQGFQDIRQLSQTSLLYSSMLMEERMILGGRGTDSGFVGALAAPTAVAATDAAAGAGQTGNTADIAHLFIYVTATGIWGESLASTVLDHTGLSAATGDVTTVTWTDTPGALGYHVYAGTTTGIANAFSCGTTSTNSFVINFTGAGTGGAPSTGAQPGSADASASATDYDGFLTVLGDSTQSGYVKRLNATFSSSNPGSEFQTAFASLYDSVKSDPDEIFFNGNDRKQLSDALKTGNPTAYRLTVTQDELGGVVLGDVVTSMANEVTGKRVNLTVHPWLPQGNCPIISWTLPIPDTEVSNTAAIVNVQDYMAISWPSVQFTHDSSSYWYGSMVHYAPAWSALVQGITKA